MTMHWHYLSHDRFLSCKCRHGKLYTEQLLKIFSNNFWQNTVSVHVPSGRVQSRVQSGRKCTNFHSNFDLKISFHSQTYTGIAVLLTSVLPCSHLDKSSVDMKSTEMKVYYILYFSSYSFVSWQKKTNEKMLPFWEKWVANNLYINPALSLWLHRYTDFTCIKVLIWKVRNGTLVNFDIAHSNGCLCNGNWCLIG